MRAGRARSGHAARVRPIGRCTVIAGALPPLANRGVVTGGETPEEGGIGLRTLISASVDWLSVTVGPSEDAGSVGAYLMTLSTLDEPGRPQRGFKQSERRAVIGGYAWRKWDPYVRSERWGDRYESWECSGSPASSMSMHLRGRAPVKPTRVDVAFDFQCDEDQTSDAVAEAMRERHEARGLTSGVSGQDGVNTRYIGAASSDYRVRIYRKDLQDPAFRDLIDVPVMRVELVLKADRAWAWWTLWDCDMDRALAAASSFVHEVTGLRPLPGEHGWPELVMPDGADVAGQLAMFIEQHGSLLATMQAAGVDVVALAKDHAAWSAGRPGPAGRQARSRMLARTRAVREVGADVLASMVASILRQRRGGSASAVG